MKKKLIGLGLIAGAIVAAVKMLMIKKEQWQGRTEAEMREWLEQRIPNRVPEEKRDAAIDKVVATMQDRGVLVEDDEPVGEPEADAVAQVEEVAEAAEAAPEEDEKPE